MWERIAFGRKNEGWGLVLDLLVWQGRNWVGPERSWEISPSVTGQAECRKPPAGGGSVVVQRGQAIQLEGTVVITEVSVTGWGSARDSKQGIENDTGSSTENMRSLVLGNKMYQEGKGEPTGGKR